MTDKVPALAYRVAQTRDSVDGAQLPLIEGRQPEYTLPKGPPKIVMTREMRRKKLRDEHPWTYTITRYVDRYMDGSLPGLTALGARFDFTTWQEEIVRPGVRFAPRTFAFKTPRERDRFRRELHLP